MSEHQPTSNSSPDPPASTALAAERERLRELDASAFVPRTLGYLKLMGPGYLQSAMTLGGGTAASSLFAGALFGYRLLWVAPVAMLLGVIMLAAISHQTLSTGMRPFDAMRRFAGSPLAYGWAIGALLASIIWHFPQYALAAGVLVDMGSVLGIENLSPAVMGFAVLVWAVLLSMLYGRSARMVRLYERILKYMVWGVVLCFGLVVMRTGIPSAGDLLRGFVPFPFPADRNGIAAFTLIVSGLSAAVGINMVFLYPYSLRSRGWGREHRRLARLDLVFGMLVPYVIATSLMIIATANTLHADGAFTGKSLAPVEAAQALATTVGPTLGRVVFNLGVLGMALSSITLHMLTAGFVATELFGWEPGSFRYRLATLLPTPGVLGPLFWSNMAVWLAVPTNIVCGFFLPVAYVGFLRLQRNKDYLQEDRPEGLLGSVWFVGMVVATLVLVVFLGWYAVTRGPGFVEQLRGLGSSASP